MSFFSTVTSKKTASGIVYTGECYLCGMHIGTDATNDPTITIYDGTDNTGTEIVPTAAYEADYKGLNGFETSYPILCSTGIYVEITCAGTVTVITKYRAKNQIQKLPW